MNAFGTRARLPDVALDAAYHIETVRLVRAFIDEQAHRIHSGQVTHDGRIVAGKVEDMFADMEALCVGIEQEARSIADEPDQAELFDAALTEADWRRESRMGEVA
jgi:hypothetical protein